MILNLTPHPIRLYSPDRPDGIDDLEPGLLRVIDPEPTPARLDTLPLSTEYRDGVRVELVSYGYVQGIPPQRTSVSCVVSLPVALALAPRRDDLLVPYREVRNSAGTVIGCRQLAQPV
ncbi:MULTISPECIES: hypothetical protein [Streptomyces]|uniref:hypothetical protein n=1 Tax=Streptomyces TaxID=1883 RepID=UPI00167379E3|nr:MULTISPECIES: hypothetical protein [Streptomyces]MBK3524805.1 hypothetical protein [Streptomyces sp. MBT70]GGR71235.1 hypothetical protein GCM10010236_26940 [Streptomyces eurythermus]